MADVLHAFIEISLTAAVMICLIGAFRALFAKKVNPLTMTVLWLAVLLRLCVPYTIESPIHAGDLIQMPQAIMSTPRESAPMPVIDPAPVMAFGEIMEMDDTGEYTGIADTPEAKPAQTPEPTFIDRIGEWLRGVSLWNVLSIAWIMGAAGMLLWTLHQALLFKREVSEGCEVTDAAVLETVATYKKQLGIKRHIRIMQCSCVDTPAIFGYLRPYLLLPRDFVREVEGERLTHVLLHELCHIRRQDLLTGYVWLLAKALHWFNPLVWTAYRLYRDDVEHCCDRMVLRHLGTDPYAYSQTLIDVVRSSKQNAVVAAASLCENRQKLKERVIRMLNPQKRSRFAVAVSLLLGIVMLVGCFTTACRPKAESTQKIVFKDEYVAGQDAQYWYIGDSLYTEMADGGNRYYFMGGFNDSFLLYKDKTTGEVAPLCNQPGCEHQYDPYKAIKKGDICNANLAAYDIHSLIYYGDTLYALGRNGNYGDDLYELDLDGGVPAEAKLITSEGVFVGSIAFHRGYVYYSAQSNDNPYETDPYLPRTVYLYRLPIDDLDAEPEMLYSMEGGLATIGKLLCYGNYVFFYESYYTDAKTIDFSIRRINRYNIKTGKVETILDDNVGWRYAIFDGRLAYSAMNGTYLCDLDGKNNRRISNIRGTLSSGEDYLVIDTLDYMYEGSLRRLYAYDGEGNLAGCVRLDDWENYPDPIGIVDGMYIIPSMDYETDTQMLYGMPVEKIADGTAVPEVFYEYVPET